MMEEINLIQPFVNILQNREIFKNLHSHIHATLNPHRQVLMSNKEEQIA